MKNKIKQKQENFVQFVRKSENFWELIKRRPSAYVLLSIVAMRAKRTDSTNFDDLEIGEAYIGDYKNYGSTEQKYRTDKKFLETHKFLTTKSTTKGTVAKLIDKTIFDINEKKLTNELTNSQRTPNEHLTTNNNENNDNNVKEENTLREVSRFSESPKKIQNHIRPILVYAVVQNIDLSTPELKQSFIKRNVRIGKLLAGYTDTEIIAAILYTRLEATKLKYDLSLETVGKKIDLVKKYLAEGKIQSKTQQQINNFLTKIQNGLN